MATIDHIATPLPGVIKGPTQWPEVRSVDVSDLTDILGLAVNDMRRAPAHSMAFGIVYALGGFGLSLLLMQREMPYLIYPLAMGFALIAPFVGAGLYDISRRLEAGEQPTWDTVFNSMCLACRRDLRWMAFVTAFAFIIWMDIAAMITFAFMGFQSTTMTEFVREVFTTPNGLLFLGVGNVAGAIIAAAVFAISVIAFPLLYDRDVDFVTAMVTSVRLVLRNKMTMLAWALTIAWMMVVSALSGFLALVFILPLLGHATWHLYRKAVAPPAPLH
jgi:uncharacterized membrane protein